MGRFWLDDGSLHPPYTLRRRSRDQQNNDTERQIVNRRTIHAEAMDGWMDTTLEGRVATTYAVTVLALESIPIITRVPGGLGVLVRAQDSVSTHTSDDKTRERGT